MFKRLSLFGIIFIPSTLGSIYLISLLENQKPWLIGWLVFIGIMMVIGNIYVLFGPRE